MDPNSESLLTQILYLVQELHNDMSVYDERLSITEQLTTDLQVRLENVIDNAFPDGNFADHKAWHERRDKGPIRRFLLKLLS